MGGLVSGLLVYLIAPEAEGHGTDAMIDAFHQRGGYIRKRVPLVKILASAITIGSGGSAGKEGPIAQIGAGFGSFFATVFKLKPRDRRILVLAGAAGGIGAIFHAPLGAALFAPEVLYRETEFESEAILPCIVSSIVASSIFDQYFGRTALFFPGPVDFAPVELLPYALFGVVCAGVGYLYVKLFYDVARDRIFRRVKLPKMLKPALGGLMLGVVALLFPQIMDGGYGWVQAALEGKIFWGTMLLLALMKIVATSCTISSGGSGGVFGPSMVIGATLGAAVVGRGEGPGAGPVGAPAAGVPVYIHFGPSMTPEKKKATPRPRRGLLGANRRLCHTSRKRAAAQRQSPPRERGRLTRRSLLCDYRRDLHPGFLQPHFPEAVR